MTQRLQYGPLFLSVWLAFGCSWDGKTIRCNEDREPLALTGATSEATGAQAGSAAAPAGSAAPPRADSSDPFVTGRPPAPTAGASMMSMGGAGRAGTGSATGAAGMATATGPMTAAGTSAAAGTSGAAGMSAAGMGAAGMSTAGTSAAGTDAAGMGAAGMGASAAGMPALEPGALQCPNEVCAPLPALPEMAASAGFKIENCCAEGGDCGTSVNAGACNRTADSFPDCPPLMAMGFTVPSCCTAMGQCGIDGSSFMRGCMALEDLAASAGAFIDVPEPKACTPAM